MLHPNYSAAASPAGTPAAPRGLLGRKAPRGETQHNRRSVGRGKIKQKNHKDSGIVR